MENIKFEITESDIKEYLKQHKDDEIIKHNEAMFVKYMKEQTLLTTEAMEILMCKYNDFDIEPVNIMGINNSTNQVSYGFPSFNNYLNKIKNLDASGICHILIPTFRSYNLKEYIPVGDLRNSLNIIARKLNVSNEDPGYALRSTLDNYILCDKIGRDSLMPMFITTFKMSRKDSKYELAKYANFYGEDKVEKIKKLIMGGIE